jgi:hypothetical protein
MRTLIAASVLALSASAVSAQTPACSSRTSCAEVTAFVATVTDFRQSKSGYDHVVTATVRFTNKTNRPLILGYVQRSGVVTDDQGIRYAMYEPAGVSAIGMVTGNTFDSKFTLQPGESSDARFEFGWRPTRGAIFGTTFAIDLGIREIDLVVNNQYRLGREHALHYSGFGAPAQTVAAGPSPAPPPAQPAPAPAAVDPCAGKARCYSTAVFAAEVTSLTKSVSGVYHDNVLDAMIRFRNLSSEPLVLAYVGRSNSMVDDRGNRYFWGRAGGPDGSVKGMGMSFGNKVDPSFVLRPGESRDAKFSLWLRPGRAILGSSYSLDFTLHQIELLPSNQIRVLREYAVSFHDLSPSKNP